MKKNLPTSCSWGLRLRRYLYDEASLVRFDALRINDMICSDFCFTKMFFKQWHKFYKKMELLFQILGIICMACGAPARIGGTHFFLFVVVLTFLITSFWILIYLFAIREGLMLRIPWITLVGDKYLCLQSTYHSYNHSLTR